MTLLIDGEHYEIKYDYLHRGINPRFVLKNKEGKENLSVQFDNTSKVLECLKYQNDGFDKSGWNISQEDFKGLLYTSKWQREVTVNIVMP